MMREEGMEVPDMLKFASAFCLQNGGVIYEVTKADDAHWLRKDAAQKAFLDNFGGQAVIKSRAYNMIVKYLPISFNPADAAHLEDAERFSDLDPGTIKQARWIKPQGRQSCNQHYAHVLLTLGNADTANIVI
ncbi:hypothetical protein A0H81_14886 [Grifola frondosa]|uniref:Uncharacterized protein n=1 Tax=Grifola frondosa TaxID=5627 RepID=A0A1C7LMH5_GRIFR|nr:hypothetical protein A0H81_14886 [Grifola frondosa]